MANTITTKGVLIVNGEQVTSTFNKLHSETKKLQQELKKLTPASKEFMDKAEELRRVKAQFDAVRQEVFATNKEIEKGQGFFSRFFGKIAGGLVQFEAWSKVGDILTSTTKDLLKIADAITAVQKTSGLAQKEVEALFKEFGNFDTRTSRMELMNIAQIGGRLGITDKTELQEFTREIDKIYVALGDSFQGGLEEVTTKVGKLKNLFDETKNTDYASALNEIGSALNELGANGTASESNITEFATRIGQLPASLKPAIDKTLGLGAAFEESGIDAEIAASGYSRFMSVAGNNLKGFAQQMRISYEEAQKLFNEKPEEFFIKFGESMKGLSADQTAGVLKDLKLNTLEVQKALGAAGDNAGRFREMMLLSGKAMVDGTSIAEEFSKVNNNSAAIWEKIGRTIKEFLTDGIIPDLFNWLTKIAGKITGITSEAGDGIVKFKQRLFFLVDVIKVVIYSFVGYKTAVIAVAMAQGNLTKSTLLHTIAEKASAVAIGLKQTALLAYRLVIAGFTLSKQRATIAVNAFNAAVKMSPWGALSALVIAVVSAIVVFSKSVDEVTKKQRLLNDIQNDVTRKMRNEKREVEDLIGVIRDSNRTRKEQEDALKRLQKIAPKHFENLDLDAAKTLKGKQAIDEYIKSLDKKYRLETLNERIGEAKNKYEEERTTKNAIEKSDWHNTATWFRSDEDYEATYDEQMAKEKARLDKLLKNKKITQRHYNADLKNLQDRLGSIYENKNQEMRELKNSIEIMEEERRKILESDVSLITQPDEPIKPTDGDGGDDDGKKTSKKQKYRAGAEEQAQSELLKVQRDNLKKQQEFYDENQSLIEESLDKQISAIEVSIARKKIALAQENEDIALEIKKIEKQIAEFQEKIKDPETSQAEKSDLKNAIVLHEKVIEEKRLLSEKNTQMEVALENTQQQKINEVRQKWELSQIDKQQKDFEKKINRLKTEKELEIAEITSLEEAKKRLQEEGFSQNLAKIKNLEEAKKALQEQANKKILEQSLSHLTAQKQLLTEALKGLTGEAAEKLQEDLDKLNEKLVQVKSSLNPSEGGKQAPPSEGMGRIMGTPAESVDILGFSAGQWEAMFLNLDTTEGKLNAVGMAMQALANAGSMFAESQRQNNEKELQQFSAYQERRRKSLENQLNSGLITQSQYYLAVKDMEKDMANKKAEMEEKQFRAEKAGRLFSAIGSTAQAVAQALTAGPIMGPILAGIVGALGAIQIGIISAQQPPAKASYAQGGFTKGIGFTDETGYEVAGVVHKNEYVIPEWLLKDPQVANIAQYLENRRVKGNRQQGLGNSFAEGGWVAPTGNFSSSVDGEKVPLSEGFGRTIERLTDVLEKIDRNGIEAFLLADAQNGKKMHEAIKQYQQLQEKSKIGG